jgi:anti-anti-sigma factor
MHVEVRGADRVVLHGAIDFYSAGVLRERGTALLLDAERLELVVDMTDVAYLTFEGLAALVQLRDEAERAGASVRIVGLGGQPAEIVGVSGLGVALTGVSPALEP